VTAFDQVSEAFQRAGHGGLAFPLACFVMGFGRRIKLIQAVKDGSRGAR